MEGADGTLLLPPTLPLSGMSLDERGAFLLDNGRVFVLWLGRMLDPQWGQQVCACVLVWLCACMAVCACALPWAVAHAVRAGTPRCRCLAWT